MFRPPYAELKQKTKKNIRPLNGGLNNGYDAFAIKNNQISEGSNLSSRNFPSISPRLPRTTVLSALTTPRHLGKRESSFITAVDGNKWKYYNSGWIDLAALTGTGFADSADMQGVTILVNGTDKKAWNGTTVVDITEMPVSDFVEVSQNRVFAASKSNDSLYFSAIAAYDDWNSPSNAGEIRIATRDNDSCTGLVEFNGHVVYFKTRSIHELYGSGPSNYFVQTLTTGTGCVDGKSIVEIDGILYFMGEDGIYYYGGGTVPKKLSYPNLDGFIYQMDTSRGVVAGTDGVNLYMSIPYGASSRVLVTFNTNTKIFLPEDDINILEFLYFEGVLYGLKSDGNIIKMNDSTGTEVVSWSFTTKAFDEGVISTAKSISSIWLVANIPIGSSVVISISDDAIGSTYTTVATITGVADIQKSRHFVPHSFTKMADWYRIKISGTGPATIHNIEMDVRIKSSTF